MAKQITISPTDNQQIENTIPSAYINQGGNYSDWLKKFLWDILCKVIDQRAPNISNFLADPENAHTNDEQTNRDFLQATNIWFH